MIEGHMAVAPQGGMARELPLRIDGLATARVWRESGRRDGRCHADLKALSERETL